MELATPTSTVGKPSSSSVGMALLASTESGCVIQSSGLAAVTARVYRVTAVGDVTLQKSQLALHRGVQVLYTINNIYMRWCVCVVNLLVIVWEEGGGRV